MGKGESSLGIAPRLVAGTRVGGAYLVEDCIGVGGMGSVYRARRTADGQAVALKVVRDATPDRVLRLEREARLAAAIRHPNIVRVHEVTTHDGLPVVVMELLHGETLAAKLRRESTLSVPDAARIVIDIVGALEAAHRSHVVHRDMKPENVFLTTAEGRPHVKVLDFGIAKAIDGADISAVLPTLETRTGHVLGTPQYMAPEQIFGQKDVDGRADIWSLGVILYEALAGARPFDGENVGQVFKAIALDPPIPLAQRKPSLPPEILGLVGHMLSHSREARLSDVGEVRAVLAPFAEPRPATPSTLTPPTPPPLTVERTTGRRGLGWGLVAAATLVGAASITSAAMRMRSTADVAALAPARPGAIAPATNVADGEALPVIPARQPLEQALAPEPETAWVPVPSRPANHRPGATAPSSEPSAFSSSRAGRRATDADRAPSQGLHRSGALRRDEF